MKLKKPDQIRSTMATVGAEPDYTSQDKSQEMLIVRHFEKREWLGGRFTDRNMVAFAFLNRKRKYDTNTLKKENLKN